MVPVPCNVRGTRPWREDGIGNGGAGKTNWLVGGMGHAAPGSVRAQHGGRSYTRVYSSIYSGHPVVNWQLETPLLATFEGWSIGWDVGFVILCALPWRGPLIGRVRPRDGMNSRAAGSRVGAERRPACGGRVSPVPLWQLCFVDCAACRLQLYVQQYKNYKFRECADR